MTNIGWGHRLRALVVGVVALVVLAPGRASADALNLNFDDLGGGCQNNFGVTNPAYQGFVWSASWVTECDADYQDPDGWNNSYGSPSGDHAAFNGFGEFAVSLSRDTPFDLLGGMVSAWTTNDALGAFGSSSLTIDGYLGGNYMGTLFQVLGSGYAPLAGSLTGVDELWFYASEPGKAWLLDDVHVQVEAEAIPEPASLLLLGSGLGLVTRLRARRAAKSRGASVEQARR